MSRTEELSEVYEQDIERSRLLLSHKYVSASNMLRKFSWVTLIIPIIICFFFVKDYAVNAPFYDDWDYIPLLAKAWSGHLSPIELISVQHNTHKLFVPFGLMLISDLATRYDSVVHMYIGFSCLVIQLIALAILVRPRCQSMAQSLIALLPVAWLILNLKQWEILLWGATLPIFCVNLFFVLTVTLLDCTAGLRWRFPLSLISAFCCTFSMFNGLLVWPLGFIQLFLTDKLSNKRNPRLPQLLIAWIFIAVLSISTYFCTFIPASGSASSSHFFSHLQKPLELVLYYVLFLGGSLSTDRVSAMIIGTVVCGVLVWLFFSLQKGSIKLTATLVAPLVLISYGLMTGVLIEIGRARFGLDYAISSRYASYGAVLLSAIYIFVALARSKGKKWQQAVQGTFLFVIVLGTISTMLAAKSAAEGHYDTNLLWKTQLQTFDKQSDETLHYIYEDPQHVRNYATFLKENRLSIFAEPQADLSSLTKVSPNYKCSLRVEQIDSSKSPPDSYPPQITIDRHSTDTITIKGWAVDMQAHKACHGMIISIDDRLNIPACYGLTRRDIARSLRRNSYLRCGFQSTFKSTLLSKGPHDLFLKAILSDGKSYYQSSLITKLSIE